MDYQEKATILRVCSSKKGERCSRCPAFGQGSRVCMRNAMKDGATAIEELLSRLEKAESALVSHDLAYHSLLGDQTVWPKMQVAFRFEDEVSKPSEDQWSWIMGRFMKGE